MSAQHVDHKKLTRWSMFYKNTAQKFKPNHLIRYFFVVVDLISSQILLTILLFANPLWPRFTKLFVLKYERIIEKFPMRVTSVRGKR